ncbi:MAG: hypothetical protein JSW45_02550 [Thiotrichales bacterium]|nr:MAG: hypothetical protein JSW45_02550 [Thiotrichales bacterium]
MVKLSESLRHWQSASFDKTLKKELEALPTGTLPLAEALTRCGKVDDSNVSAVVISSSGRDGRIQSRVSIFFTEIVAGCVCGEDPVPENAHCEMLVSIDTSTGEAEFQLISS